MKISVFRFKFLKSQQWRNIGSDNGLMLNGRQAIIWTSDDIVWKFIYVSLGLKE